MKTGISLQKKPSAEQTQKQVGIKPAEKLFMSHHELLFGPKQSTLSRDLIDVNSKNDFPTLGTGLQIENKNQTWGKNIFEANAPSQPKLAQQKSKTVEEAFPTLPGSKSIFTTPQSKAPVVIEKKPEPPNKNSIFEEQKFEEAKPKDNDVIMKKPGKKGKGKPVAVEVKGNFY